MDQSVFLFSILAVAVFNKIVVLFIIERIRNFLNDFRRLMIGVKVFT